MESISCAIGKITEKFPLTYRWFNIFRYKDFVGFAWRTGTLRLCKVCVCRPAYKWSGLLCVRYFQSMMWPFSFPRKGIFLRRGHMSVLRRDFYCADEIEMTHISFLSESPDVSRERFRAFMALRNRNRYKSSTKRMGKKRKRSSVEH